MMKLLAVRAYFDEPVEGILDSPNRLAYTDLLLTTICCDTNYCCSFLLDNEYIS